jgi:hypothetical protein
LEEVSDPAVPTVELLRIAPVQPVHSPRKLGEIGLDDEMEVVRHQTCGVKRPFEALERYGQEREEGAPVEIVVRDLRPSRSADGHVERPAGTKKASRSARHFSTVKAIATQRRAGARFAAGPSRRRHRDCPCNGTVTALG